MIAIITYEGAADPHLMLSSISQAPIYISWLRTPPIEVPVLSRLLDEKHNILHKVSGSLSNHVTILPEPRGLVPIPL